MLTKKNVALIGTRTDIRETVIEKVKEETVNVDVTGYSSLDDFNERVNNRGSKKYFDRLLIVSNYLNESTFVDDLKKYWEWSERNVEIILVLSGNSADLKRSYSYAAKLQQAIVYSKVISIIQPPNISDGIAFMTECCLSDVLSLYNQYGYKSTSDEDAVLYVTYKKVTKKETIEPTEVAPQKHGAFGQIASLLSLFKPKPKVVERPVTKEDEISLDDPTIKIEEVKEALPRNNPFVLKDISLDKKTTGQEEQVAQFKNIVLDDNINAEFVKRKHCTSLADIYAGNTHEIILVTGARGSGVTLSALGLAVRLAENTECLYFDADIITHGLWSSDYTDYTQYQKQGDGAKRGVKVCSSPDTLKHVTFKMSDGLNILSSDFDIKVTSDELVTTCKTVVANHKKYGTVVIDCPLEQLPYMTSALPFAHIVFNVENTFRGYYNAVLELEHLGLSDSDSILQQLRAKSTVFLTKNSKSADADSIYNAVTGLSDMPYACDSKLLDIFSNTRILFKGSVTDELLEGVLMDGKVK